MSVYILLNKYLYETLAISCKNIEYGLYIYFLLPATRTGVAVFTASLGLCMRCSPLFLTATLPPLSLFLYASAADCLRLLCFRFGNWPVLFIYAYLKVMPSRLGLPCLSLLWLALPCLGCVGPFKTVCFAGLQVMP